MSYSERTLSHIQTLQLSDRKKLGQYMTPSQVADALATALHLPERPGVVLDPAVGTGELLLAVGRQRPGGAVLAGWDTDEGMVATAAENVPGSMIEHLSLFSDDWRGREGSVDYIIANPPYFEIKKNDPRLGTVTDFVTAHSAGRLNIFSLFFEYGLRLLKNGGRMAFLVPPSMNNGAYFRTLRNAILSQGRIVCLSILRDDKLFSDAQTATQIIVIQKTGNSVERNIEDSAPYIHMLDNTPIFTDKAATIQAYWEGKRSLTELGYMVTTGTIPWNQYKEQFVSEHTPNSVPLLYSKDITNEHTLVLSSKIPDTRRWLPAGMKTPTVGEAILVNRIVGSLSNPALRFARTDGAPFYGENHVNVIKPGDNPKVSLGAVFEALQAMDRAQLGEYLSAVTGNTQLSATELANNLPLPL